MSAEVPPKLSLVRSWCLIKPAFCMVKLRDLPLPVDEHLTNDGGISKPTGAGRAILSTRAYFCVDAAMSRTAPGYNKSAGASKKIADIFPQLGYRYLTR
jgi:hypothetical protein